VTTFCEIPSHALLRGRTRIRGGKHFSTLQSTPALLPPIVALSWAHRCEAWGAGVTAYSNQHHLVVARLGNSFCAVTERELRVVGRPRGWWAGGRWCGGGGGRWPANRPPYLPLPCMCTLRIVPCTQVPSRRFKLGFVGFFYLVLFYFYFYGFFFLPGAPRVETARGYKYTYLYLVAADGVGIQARQSKTAGVYRPSTTQIRRGGGSGKGGGRKKKK
jgi:hypothetical protein